MKRRDDPTNDNPIRDWETVLGKTADKVLAYRAPARTKKAKKRARKRRKVQRESCI